MKRYQIRITKDNGDYVILEDKDNSEYIKHLFDWYVAHSSFFNGRLSIEEV